MKLVTIAICFCCLIQSALAQSTPPPENPYSELSGASGPIKRPAAPPNPAPQTPDGKPDLSGFWKGPLIIGGMFNSQCRPPRTSAVEDAHQDNLSHSIYR